MFYWTLHQRFDDSREDDKLDSGTGSSREEAWNRLEEAGAKWATEQLAEGRKELRDHCMEYNLTEEEGSGELSNMYANWKREAGEEPPETCTKTDFADQAHDYDDHDKMDISSLRKYCMCMDYYAIGRVREETSSG